MLPKPLERVIVGAFFFIFLLLDLPSRCPLLILLLHELEVALGGIFILVARKELRVVLNVERDVLGRGLRARDASARSG